MMRVLFLAFCHKANILIHFFILNPFILMKKITFLLALFCMLLSTATAQTRVPSSTLLTVDQLNNATESVYLAIKCISRTNSYRFCGNKSVQSNTDQEIIFVWEPSGDGESHYLKKYAPTAAQGEGYLQAGNNNTNLAFGAQSSAQKLKAVTATLPNDGSDIPVEGTNTEAGYIVRFAEAAGTAYWVNVQTPTGTPKYNTGQGLYTMYNIYQTEETDEFIASTISTWDQIANTKLFTLSTSRSQLTVSNDYTQGKTTNDIGGTFDANNEQYQWAILQHAANSNYYLYNKAANKFLCKDQTMSTTPTDAVQNLPQSGGTFVLKFDDTHYINMGGSNQLVIDDWGTADAGNKFTITHVANWEPSEDLLRLLGYGITYRSVTINYNVGAKTYLSTTIEVEDGTTLSASHFNHLSATRDYVTVSDWDKKDAITEDCTVNVSCTVSDDCPLIFSESFEKAVWQMVNMHSNESNYVWSVNLDGEGQPTMNVINKGGAESYKTYMAPEDKDLWAFVGDITGFQIYNMAAGGNYVLSKPTDGDNAVTWTAPADGTIYTAHRTATSISNGACILPKGHTYYLNHRQPNIQGWTSRDEGSTVRSFAPDAFLQAYHAELPPYGALGTSSFFSNYQTVELYLEWLAALETNHYDMNMVWNMGKFLQSAAESDVIPTVIDPNTYYRLVNASSKTFVTSGLDGEGNALWGGLDRAAANRTAGTIVKFEQDGDNYKLYTQGLGFGNVTQSAQVTLEDESSSFEITNNDNLFSFRDVNSTDATYNYLHYQAADGKIVGWENGETTTASKWYLVPVKELVVELNPVGGRTYATTFLPYDFTLDPRFNVKAYMVTHAEGDVAKTMQVEDIAAEEGVILVGDTEEDNFLLLIPGTATSDFSDNILSGTTTRLPITEEEKTTLFVLGNGSNGIGFYNPSSTTLKENRAFLTADAVTGEATNGLRLEFGGEPTGITATETLNNANAPIYDLSGRRVANPVKGIYVKGGKKIYVK